MLHLCRWPTRKRLPLEVGRIELLLFRGRPQVVVTSLVMYFSVDGGGAV